MIIIYKPIDIRRVRLEKFRSPFYDDVIYRDESYLWSHERLQKNLSVRLKVDVDGIFGVVK